MNTHKKTPTAIIYLSYSRFHYGGVQHEVFCSLDLPGNFVFMAHYNIAALFFFSKIRQDAPNYTIST